MLKQKRWASIGHRGFDSLEPRLLMAAPDFYDGRITGTVDSPDIRFASGIVASRSNSGVLWTFNDVGDSRVFALDSQGDRLGTFSTGATVHDYEDIAVGPGPQAGTPYLYVADIGDNAKSRDSIQVVRVLEPAVSPSQAPVTTTLSGVQTITLLYPDGPHDAETLLVDPANGDVYVVTKSGARGRIYSTPMPPATAGTITLQFRGELTWTGAAGGDISPDGREIIMKDLDTVFYYDRPTGTSIPAALADTPITLPYAMQQLGEGITFDADGRGYFTNSEGTNQPLYYYERKAPASPFQFTVIGGYGVDGPNEQAVAKMVHAWDPSVVVTTGGNNLPQGASATIDRNIGKHYQRLIDDYTGDYGVGASVNRFFPALGPQDWATSSAAPYLSYFALPDNERYYDFVRGPVHFFALSSSASEPDGRSSTSAQAQWLQSAMAASTSEFQVVYFYDAPYSSGTNGGNAVMRWPFSEWGADAVIAGSDALYERLTVGGIPYFVVGNSGQTLGQVQTVQPGSQYRDASRHGAVLVTAGAGQLTWEYYSSDGVMRDRYIMSSAAPAVIGRYVFYNQSNYDGNNPAANAGDDAAIAADKVALLPGGTASFANYTSYNRGINGIMIDIDGLPAASLTAGDFEFKVGNSNTPSSWTTLAASPNVTVRPTPGVPAASRVTLVWPSGAAIKQWLQVTVKANTNTGLARPDVFYFGNAVGESGNVVGDYSVSITDELLARNNPASITPGATVTNRFDYNRDGTVSVVDQLLARNNITTSANRLKQITVPAALQANGLTAPSLNQSSFPAGFSIGTTDREGDALSERKVDPIAVAKKSPPRNLNSTSAGDIAASTLRFDLPTRQPRTAGELSDDLLQLLARNR